MRRTPSTSPRRYAGAAAVAAAGLLLAACGGGGSDPLAEKSDSPSGSGSGGSGGSVTIGSANFYESSLLAEIYAGALEAKGVKVDTKLNIGAREVYLKAMEPGDASVDIIPEYTGVLRDYYKPDQKGTTSDEVYQELTDSLPDYLTALD